MDRAGVDSGRKMFRLWEEADGSAIPSLAASKQLKSSTTKPIVLLNRERVGATYLIQWKPSLVRIRSARYAPLTERLIVYFHDVTDFTRPGISDFCAESEIEDRGIEVDVFRAETSSERVHKPPALIVYSAWLPADV